MANAKFTITRNDVSPALSKLAATARNPKNVLRSGGNVFKSITEGNFNSAGAAFRPAAWPAKKDGSVRTLKKSGLLSHSFHLTVSDQAATVSNPTPYATVHQFGSGQVDAKRKAAAKKKGTTAHTMNIPAAPFFPVINGKLTPASEEKIGSAMKRQILRESGTQP